MLNIPDRFVVVVDISNMRSINSFSPKNSISVAVEFTTENCSESLTMLLLTTSSHGNTESIYMYCALSIKVNAVILEFRSLDAAKQICCTMSAIIKKEVLDVVLHLLGKLDIVVMSVDKTITINKAIQSRNMMHATMLSDADEKDNWLIFLLAIAYKHSSHFF